MYPSALTASEKCVLISEILLIFLTLMYRDSKPSICRYDVRVQLRTQDFCMKSVAFFEVQNVNSGRVGECRTVHPGYV